MREYLLKPHIITAILAIFFCICGHVFMTAYTDYHITQKKLELLQNQERFFKNRAKGLEQKKTVIEQTKIFIDHADRSGLLKEKWDKFSVDLKGEPISFSQLKALLLQANTTDQYYFLPESLVIHLGGMEKSPEKKEVAQDTMAIHNKASIAPVIPDPLISGSDAAISLKGLFLVQQRRQDE